MRRIIDYSPQVKITNLDALPRGLRCPYLLAVESPYAGEYVAKQWKRRMPPSTKRGEVVIRF